MKAIEPIWKGQEVWILGGGASLPREFNIPEKTIQQVMSKKASPAIYSPYLKALHDKNVIAVNAAYLLGDWVDYVFFGDLIFWQNHKEALLESGRPLVSCHSHFKTATHPSVMYLPKKKAADVYGLSANPAEVIWNGNSGAAAINFAVHLGAKKIYLLGFDMCDLPDSHWHKEYSWQSNKVPYPRHLKCFPAVAKDAINMGVEIINVSPNSAISVFSKQSAQEVLNLPRQAKSGRNLAEIKIGAVTPTCSVERKPFLDFLKKRVSEQTRKPDVHLIIDYPNPGKLPDLCKRFKEGIAQCFAEGCDFVVFLEDDDCYSVNYIAELAQKWLDSGEPVLIGGDTTRYYHIVSRGYGVMTPPKHASAHCSAVGKGVKLDKIQDTNPFFDISLWKRNKGVLVYLENPVISIKHNIGLCGGRGHRGHEYKLKDSEDFAVLREWVDEEAFAVYMEIIGYEVQIPPKKLTEEEWQSLERKLGSLGTVTKITTSAEYYDEIYKTSAEYQKRLASQSMYFHIWRKIPPMLKKTERLVEIGCGVGLTAKLLLDNRYRYIQGIDFSGEAIQRAKKNNVRDAHRFAIRDIRNMTCIDENADTVLCLETLEHLTDDLYVINILPKGIKFIFSVPDFMCESHIRCFKNEEEIKQRYNNLEFLSISKNKITANQHIYLVEARKL